jgi:hypothetical protein
MKRVILGFIVIMMASCLISQQAWCREKANLYSVLKDAKEVHTYLSDVTDSSGQAEDMLPGIQQQIKDALVARQSTNFVLVNNEDDADIVITCDVIERIWMETDPIDQVHGVGAAVFDALISENYGRLRAKMLVRKGPKKVVLFKKRGGLFRRMNVLWSDTVQATITKKDMPEEDSKPLLEERLADIFIRRCFGKNAKSLN